MTKSAQAAAIPPVAVFDLDGTLVDTAPDLVGAANDLLAQYGLPAMNFARARAVSGRGGKALILAGHEWAGNPISPARVDALFPEYLALYRARIDHQSRPYPGVVSTLDTLRAQGWVLAVCTNKPEGLAVELLNRLGLAGHFAAILGADTLPVKKPDPEHLLTTIRRAGGHPSRAVMIGDTRTDLEAGRNAGVPVVLLRFGYSLEPLTHMGADALLDDALSLPQVLAEILAKGA